MKYIYLILFLLSTGFIHAQNVEITGKAIDYRTGEPLTGVIVSLSEVKTTQTNQSGEFRINNIEKGNYRLTFKLPGYETIIKKFEISNDEKKNFLIQLKYTYTNLEEVLVLGRGKSLIGVAASASEGSVSRLQLETRPILRTGEVMETVPGLIVSQHSGSGKANQFYLRGLNLDHGTDFATSLEGMPLNLPTHAHGQGYLDMNFLIPEMISQVDFRKGTYGAQEGNFASAGSANITLGDLQNSFVKAEAGIYDYYRVLVAGSDSMGKYNLTYGAEYLYSEGPWENPENTNRFSGTFKFENGDAEKGHSLTAILYNNDWNATDQIPQRAVNQGILGRFSAVDDSNGGESQRYGIVGNWWNKNNDGTGTHITGYASYYNLNLFSNFTYFMENSERGDQFEQADERFYAGAKASHRWNANWLGMDMTNEAGLQLRHDEIFEIGLYNTEARERFNTIRSDEVGESAAGVYFENKIQWAEKFRSVLGLRGDYYHFDVHSNIAANSGNEGDFITSPKLQLILGPWRDTEFYVNLGTGFHSNDARGTTITLDPASGENVDNVDPLVRSKGAEVGVKTTAIKGLQSTLALWYLGLDSELVFVGDAGGTEASDASNHFGIEWTNYYKPADFLTLDLDISLNHSRFTDIEDDKDRIPNSINTTIKAGATTFIMPNWYAGLRLRYFGAQPLTETGEPKSQDTNILNFRTAYQWNDFTFGLDVLNVLDAEDPDISYFYASRLRDEQQAVEDIHFHPVLPRTARFSVSYMF